MSHPILSCSYKGFVINTVSFGPTSGVSFAFDDAMCIVDANRFLNIFKQLVFGGKYGEVTFQLVSSGLISA